MFPDKFRIDFGDLSNGDAVIFANDSAYNFRKGLLKSASADKNDLLFLLGGLYFYSFEKDRELMDSFHFDLTKFHEARWKNREVYVIGSNRDDEKTNQIWVDKEGLVLLRFIKYGDGRKEEGILEDHRSFGGGWSETKVTFFINDQLVQKEYYRDCHADVDLDPRVFQPSEFGKLHWFRAN